MDTSPNPVWLHGLWAAVVALFWKLWAAKEKEVNAVKQDVEHLSRAVSAHNATLATHKTLHANVATAIVKLEASLERNTDEARRMADTLARIETLITGRITKE